MDEPVEITVYKKDGVTHTKFMFMEGEPLPSENFRIAMDWYKSGELADEYSSLFSSSSSKKRREASPETSHPFM